MSAFQPLPPAPSGDTRPVHRQQLRFEVVGVRRRAWKGRTDSWYVIDRMPFYNDDTPPEHAFPTKRDALNWIVEYLLTHKEHFDELRALEYERRRAKRAAAKHDEFDDAETCDDDNEQIASATAGTNTNSKGEQQ